MLFYPHPQSEVAMKHYVHTSIAMMHLTYNRQFTKVISSSFALSMLDYGLCEGEDCEYLTVSVSVPKAHPGPRSYQTDAQS